MSQNRIQFDKLKQLYSKLQFENEQLKKQIEAIAQPAGDDIAYREAVNLATTLFKKHFSHEEHYASGLVVCGLCDTTAGVISQIDNMVCRLVQPQPAVEAEPVYQVKQAIGASVWADASKDEFIEAVRHDLKRRILYTTPQQSQPLTDEQIDTIFCEHSGDGGPTAICTKFARAIEAAHGIKK